MPRWPNWPKPGSRYVETRCVRFCHTSSRRRKFQNIYFSQNLLGPRCPHPSLYFEYLYSYNTIKYNIILHLKVAHHVANLSKNSPLFEHTGQMPNEERSSEMICSYLSVHETLSGKAKMYSTKVSLHRNIPVSISSYPLKYNFVAAPQV